MQRPIEIRGQVNRLQVFRATVRFMEQHHTCPSGPEIAEITGLSTACVNVHLQALQKADGLPFPLLVGQERISAIKDSGRFTKYEEPIIEVDLAMQEPDISSIPFEE